jgi:hypothetical protein
LEESRLRELLAREKLRLKRESTMARETFITRQGMLMTERTGQTQKRSERIVMRQCEGVLLPYVALPFDDPEFRGATVADVLRYPAYFEGATLADPIEGIEYGACKAMIICRPDGKPWIHSFAHGRTIYHLRFDMPTIEAQLGLTENDQLVSAFEQLVLNGDLSVDETAALCDVVSSRTGIGRRALETRLKRAREEQEVRQHEEELERRVAERRDPRPLIAAPPPDAPWLSHMQVLNDVLGTSEASEPPMRNIEGAFVEVRSRRVPNMHLLTPDGANDDEAKERRLPPPEQPLVTRLTIDELAEVIEHHIDYVNRAGRSVHLATPFVRHFLVRHDDALPVVAAVATLPIVLADGTILAGHGLSRDRGIVFRIPEQLLAQMPRREHCNDAAVTEAFKFLTDVWLCDVATDYPGKCILIAAALTLIQRSLLPDRPVFFVTSGRRGGGKTTTLIMILMAITGIRPAAAAWSPNEEERRKALLAYLMYAMVAIIWDNIPRGTHISCPHIERACTTALYEDRRLGVNELVTVAASVINFFTGNNIAPRGDLASRALSVRLEVDRPDPENRDVRHEDPVGWTEAHRGEILRALYTILLGNPHLRVGSSLAAKTRFKTWWRLVGSAVEHASAVTGRALDFRGLFLSQEEDDEESVSLADALASLADTQWPDCSGSFRAADVARMMNEQAVFRSDVERERAAVVRDFFFATTPPTQPITAKQAAKRLKRHIGEPVARGGRTLILREDFDTHSKCAVYYVVIK